MAVQRTDWVEEYVAGFFGLPLTLDTVLLRPTRRDGAIDKEVCDVLLALRRDGVAVALKSQQDPTARNGAALERWCAKAAREAATQLGGAVRTFAATPFSCQHPRRGRVDIDAGAMNVLHALAVLETAEEVALPLDLPDRTTTGVPITYLSTNDLLNLAVELRAFPDLVAYLQARLALAASIRTRIGHERLVYQYYLLSDEDFGGCDSVENAQALVSERESEWYERLRWKKALDRYATLVEHVSDTLATRLPNWKEGLDAETLAVIAPAGERQYVRLQEELCDLRLGLRRRLGRALALARETLGASPRPEDVVYMTLPDAKPDFLYVVLSSRGIARPDVMKRAYLSLLAGLAYYRRRRGMAIADRDGEGFEVAYGEVDGPTDARVLEAGRKLFAHLRLRPFDVSTLPRDSEEPSAEANALLSP